MPAPIAPPAPACPKQELPPLSANVRADGRAVSVQEHRIALAAAGVLGAIEGLARVDDRLAAIAIRTLAPTVNILNAELKAAGWTWPTPETLR